MTVTALHSPAASTAFLRWDLTDTSLDVDDYQFGVLDLLANHRGMAPGKDPRLGCDGVLRRCGYSDEQIDAPHALFDEWKTADDDAVEYEHNDGLGNRPTPMADAAQAKGHELLAAIKAARA